MHRLPRLKHFASAALLCASLACADDNAKVTGPATLGLPNATTTVVLMNDGAVALANLRVITSAEDELPRISQLAPGQTTAAYGVHAAHDFPYIEATVGGKVVVAHPVEGFSGFNPAVAPGAYVLKVRYNAEHQMIEPRMVRAAP